MKRVERLIDHHIKKKKEHKTEEPPGSAAETLAKLEEIVSENGWTYLLGDRSELEGIDIRGSIYWVDGQNGKGRVLVVIHDDGTGKLWTKKSCRAAEFSVAQVRDKNLFNYVFNWMWKD